MHNDAQCECKAGYIGTTTSKTTKPDCVQCEIGKHSTIGKSMCSDCEAGKYNPSPGSATCAGCASGKASGTLGAIHESTCKDCAAGTFSDTTSSSCSICTGNTHSGRGQGSCLQCLSGKHVIKTDTLDASKACNETDGCLVDPCPKNNDCVDIKSDNYVAEGPVRRCIYIPPDIIEKEVSIEGLGKADFPTDLAFAFKIQHFAFMVLYAFLAIMILVQIVAVEGGLGKAGMVANR